MSPWKVIVPQGDVLPQLKPSPPLPWHQEPRCRAPAFPACAMANALVLAFLVQPLVYSPIHLPVPPSRAHAALPARRGLRCALGWVGCSREAFLLPPARPSPEEHIWSPSERLHPGRAHPRVCLGWQRAGSWAASLPAQWGVLPPRWRLALCERYLLPASAAGAAAPAGGAPHHTRVLAGRHGSPLPRWESHVGRETYPKMAPCWGVPARERGSAAPWAGEGGIWSLDSWPRSGE